MHDGGQLASCFLAEELDLTEQGSWPDLPAPGRRPGPLTGLFFLGWQLKVQEKEKGPCLDPALRV